MSNLEKFKSENKPKFKLKKYEITISELMDEGYATLQIYDCLKNYLNVDFSLRTLQRTLKYLKQKKENLDKKSENSLSNRNESFNNSTKKISKEEMLRKVRGD